VLPVDHCHRAGPLADTAIVRCAQRHIHHLEQGVEWSLSSPQSEAENPLEHQEGTDGLVSVKRATASPPMMVVVEAVVHGGGINPEGE